MDHKSFYYQGLNSTMAHLSVENLVISLVKGGHSGFLYNQQPGNYHFNVREENLDWCVKHVYLTTLIGSKLAVWSQFFFPDFYNVFDEK